VESIYFLDQLSFLFGEEIKEYAWLGIVKFDWDCTLVEFIVDNLKFLTFNWDCTFDKCEHQQIETLHWLICKFTTIIYWAIIFK